jgi:3-hydroxy-9,10-secoandrosta-1,3,5(10)-triene-9,17-dione monooxygenase reductase component
MVGSVKNLIVPQQNAAPLVYCHGKMGALPMPA